MAITRQLSAALKALLALTVAARRALPRRHPRRRLVVAPARQRLPHRGRREGRRLQPARRRPPRSPVVPGPPVGLRLHRRHQRRLQPRPRRPRGARHRRLRARRAPARGQPGGPGAIPPDALTASASGLDPHISPAYAGWQAPRVARRAGSRSRRCRTIIADHTKGRRSGSSVSRGSTSPSSTSPSPARRADDGPTTGQVRIGPWPAVDCASTSGPPPGSARPSPCSTRAAGAWTAAPTSSSASSRPTAGPSPPRLAEGLEVVPRRTVDHRGADLEELDLDAVLARRPEVALVDELAHTNAPGSPRRSGGRTSTSSSMPASTSSPRSTSSTSSRSTTSSSRSPGSSNARRCPTTSSARADQIELVDMSPESLRRRMAHGNIYPRPEGRRRAGELLPAGQPLRPARAGPALAGRPRRRGAGAVPRRPRHLGTLADPRADRRRPHRRAGGRDRAAPGRPDRLPRSRRRAARLPRLTTRGSRRRRPGNPCCATKAGRKSSAA